VANQSASPDVKRNDGIVAVVEDDRLSDEALMARYRDRGDEADFNALIDRYQSEIYRYLVRYLGNATLADDVFQDTFLQIHQKRHTYEEGRAVRPWIYAIASHQAIDTMRRIGRHSARSLSSSSDEDGEAPRDGLEALLESTAEGPLAQIQTEERREWVRRAIDSLPETLRQTLILAYYQDLKYREIADILDVPVGTVKSRLHSALQKMAEKAARDHLGSGDEDG
jgi:RNA polymerase sigma-70 factor (ECF subfamily)